MRSRLLAMHAPPDHAALIGLAVPVSANHCSGQDVLTLLVV